MHVGPAAVIVHDQVWHPARGETQFTKRGSFATRTRPSQEILGNHSSLDTLRFAFNLNFIINQNNSSPLSTSHWERTLRRGLLHEAKKAWTAHSVPPQNLQEHQGAVFSGKIWTKQPSLNALAPDVFCFVHGSALAALNIVFALGQSPQPLSKQ